MAVSKVILNGTTEIDLTGDTAIADDVMQSKTFHLANGVQATGTATGGGGATIEKDVNFYDYDGTIVASYEASEIPDLAELPSVPTHSGLTAQGWNWTLADIKTQVTDTGACDVGATYTTNDNSTRLYVSLRSGRLSPCLGICPNGSVSIDWGDDTSSYLSGTSLTTPQYTTHTFSQVGDYVISISVMSGSFAIYGTGSYSHLLKRTSSSTANDNAVYLNALTRVELGGNVSIGNYAFYGCCGLNSITIPTTVTRINDGAFWNCRNLSHLTVPSSVTLFGSNLFRTCHRLHTISLPKELTTIGSNLSYDTHTFKRIVVPMGLTVTTGNCFYNNLELSEAYLSNTVTALGAGSFQSCSALQKIKMSTGLTNVGQYAFSGCSSLLSVEIPSGVTTIDSYAFSGCGSLASVTIPSTVTTINANAFNNNYGLSEIHSEPTSPPTLASTNTFGNLPTDCKIYVPAASLSAYQTATNWSTYASKMVGE